MNFIKKVSYIFILLLTIFSSLCRADDIDYSDTFEFQTFEASSSASSIPSINSRSAVILERSTGTVLFGKNENDKRKMASTTKIMTAIVVLENVSNLSEIVTVSKKAANIGGSRLGLSSNCTITVNDLLYGLLLCSGNDAAIALAEYVGESVEGFANLMNQKALDLGLNNTHFITPHGLDNEAHYTTAYELALLTQYALENETFSKIVSTKSYSVLINNSSKSISNTNELLGYSNGVYGVKTGFTNGANRCLVTACKRGNLDIICVVLGADTKKFRTQDSLKLLEYTFSNFEMLDIESIVQDEFYKWLSESSSRFLVNKGISNCVEPYIETLQFSRYPLNKSQVKDIKTVIDCKHYFEAPVYENSNIGFFKLYVGDSEILRLNIGVQNYIAKKNIFSYFDSFIQNYSVYLESIF